MNGKWLKEWNVTLNVWNCGSEWDGCYYMCTFIIIYKWNGNEKLNHQLSSIKSMHVARNGMMTSDKEVETIWECLTDWHDYNSMGVYLSFRLIVTESTGFLVGWIHFWPAIYSAVPVNKAWRQAQVQIGQVFWPLHIFPQYIIQYIYLFWSSATVLDNIITSHFLRTN